jgi:hypothetical protein
MGAANRFMRMEAVATLIGVTAWYMYTAYKKKKKNTRFNRGNRK